MVHEELVQVELPDGQVVWALVADAGPRDVAGGRAILGTKGLVEAIRGVGMNVRRGLADAAPDEVAVEFGLEQCMECCDDQRPRARAVDSLSTQCLKGFDVQGYFPALGDG